MDPETCYNLEYRIIAYNTQSNCFSFSRVVDANITNFKDLVDEIRDKYPPGYGDLVKLFYYAADTKSNIEVTTDQELLDMFAKHVSRKICFLSIAYYPASVEPPAIPTWDDECVDVPSTPSMLVPLAVDQSHCHLIQTADSSEINAEKKPLLWVLAPQLAQLQVQEQEEEQDGLEFLPAQMSDPSCPPK